MDDRDDRLRTAEERIAHLERMVEELSDVVVRQDREIDRMARRLAALVAREADREADREAEAGTPIPLADQRPPHW